MNFKKFFHFSILVMKLKSGKWKIFKIHFVFKSKNELYFRYTDYFWILFFFLIVKSNFCIYIKIISKQNIYLGYFFQPITVEVWARFFGLRKILRVGPIFWFIHTKTMHKSQVEEMRDFFSQKNIFEEVSVILQTRHSCIRGYSVKSIKPLPGSLKTICKQWFLKQLQMMCKRPFTKFTFLSNRIYSFCVSLWTLLALWIFLDKITVFKSFF